MDFDLDVDVDLGQMIFAYLGIHLTQVITIGCVALTGLTSFRYSGPRACALGSPIPPFQGSITENPEGVIQESPGPQALGN